MVPAVGQTCDGLDAAADPSHRSVWGESLCLLHRDGLSSRRTSGSPCSARSPPVLLPSFRTSPRALCGVWVGAARLSPTCPPFWLETPAVLPHPVEIGVALPGSGTLEPFCNPRSARKRAYCKIWEKRDPGFTQAQALKTTFANFLFLCSCWSPAPSSLRLLPPRTWPRSPDPPVRPEETKLDQPSDWPLLNSIVAPVLCLHLPRVRES